MNIERLVINHQFGGFGKVFANLPIYIFTTVRANGISQLALNNNNYGLAKYSSFLLSLGVIVTILYLPLGMSADVGVV